jgi:hypothetical protein
MSTPESRTPESQAPETVTPPEGSAAASNADQVAAAAAADATPAEPDFDALVAEAIAKGEGGEEEAAEGDEAETTKEGEGDKEAKAEEEKPEKKVEEPKDTKLAERLALVADGTRKNELRTKEIDARAKELDDREARIKPDLEAIQRIRGARSRSVAVQEVLGGPEALREFYVELTEYINNGGVPVATAAKPAGNLTAEQVQELIDKGVEARLTAERKARADEDTQAIKRGKAAYAAGVIETLDGAAEEFPLCFAAPPSPQAITAISDQILEDTGKLPDGRKVLQTIESHRQDRHKKATKATQTPAAGAEPKPQTNGGKPPQQPVRRNSVPVVPARALTFDEEVAAAINQQQRRAQ